MTIGHEEKRDFIRMNAKHAMQFNEVGSSDTHQGMCQNLSATGISFITEKPIPVGTELEINITPRHAIVSPFDALITVLRIQTNGSPNTFFIAGKITSIEPTY